MTFLRSDIPLATLSISTYITYASQRVSPSCLGEYCRPTLFITDLSVHGTNVHCQFLRKYPGTAFIAPPSFRKPPQGLAAGSRVQFRGHPKSTVCRSTMLRGDSFITYVTSTISQLFPPKPTFTEKDIGNLSGKVRSSNGPWILQCTTLDYKNNEKTILGLHRHRSKHRSGQRARPDPLRQRCQGLLRSTLRGQDPPGHPVHQGRISSLPRRARLLASRPCRPQHHQGLRRRLSG